MIFSNRFERTRALFSMLSSWLTPSSRAASIIVCPGPSLDEAKTIRVKRVGGPEGGEDVGVHKWILDSCSSLRGVFRPSWWLWNGHLQTLYTQIGNFESVDRIIYDRTLLRLPDGGTIGLDFVVPSFEPTPKTPILVTLHGLTGGSHESYVRNVMSHATRAKGDGDGLGMRGVVVNFRGCAGVPLTSAQMYSAGHTEDIRSALLYISETYPDAPLFGCGFSLGASVLARFIGEEGDHCVLRAGVVVGTPWDCVGMCKRLESTWLLRLYSRAMGTNILRVWNSHANSPAAHLLQPDSRAHKNIDTINAMRNPLLRETDEVIVCTIGGCPPDFPFPSSDAYYAWASPQQKLLDIRIPTLCINAFDDPIIGGPLLPISTFLKSSYAVLAIVGIGGHLGHFMGGFPFFSTPKRWLHTPIGEFLTAAEKELVDTETLPGAVKREVRRVEGKVGYEVVKEKEQEAGPFTWVKKGRVAVKME